MPFNIKFGVDDESSVMLLSSHILKNEFGIKCHEGMIR